MDIWFTGNWFTGKKSYHLQRKLSIILTCAAAKGLASSQLKGQNA